MSEIVWIAQRRFGKLCEDKDTYTVWKCAEQEGRKQRKRPYRCPHCGMIHLTSKNPGRWKTLRDKPDSGSSNRGPS